TALARIEKAQGDLNAFVHVDADGARRRAAEVEAAVRAGRDPGPLAGVPFGVKELEPVEGWPHTEASRVFAARTADHSSTEVERLVAAGAILTSVLGPMTTGVRDAARFLDCVAGVDVTDRWSLPAPAHRFEDVITSTPLAGLRVAWAAGFGYGATDPEVVAVAGEAAVALMGAAPVERVERPVDLPDTSTAWGILGSQDLFRTLAPFWPE